MKFKDFFKKYKAADKKGFTLVEMIAVVAILAIMSGATISVFIAVRQSVVNTSKVTTDQFSISQVENYIRDELQVATNIDIYEKNASGNAPAYPASYVVQDGDECFYFDSSEKCVYFMKYSEAESKFKSKLRIDSVKSVTIEIVPVDYQAALDYQAAQVAGTAPATVPYRKQPLKMFYTIEGDAFTYTGGFVLSNTKALAPDMSWHTTEPPCCEKLVWSVDPDTGSISSDSKYVVAFHSEVSKDTDTV